MKHKSAIFTLCTLLVLMPLVGAFAASPAPRDFAPVQKGFVRTAEKVLPYAPDRVLVKFTETAYKSSNLKINLQRGSAVAGGITGIASVDALGSEFGVTKITRPYNEPKNRIKAIQLGVDRWFSVRVPEGADIEMVAERYAADPNIEYAQLDYRAFPAVVPSDPLYLDHWGHNNTAQLPDLDWGGTYDHTLSTTVGTPGFDANAEAAWNAGQGFGDPNVIIAIIDSGVDIDHPDLNLVSGYDFGNNDTNPDDDSRSAGHGTCCAGVAAALANNGIGACGIAAGCSVMPCKVADNAGSMYFSYMDAALYWAADNGADIISMSLGAYLDIGDLPATDDALQYAYNAGCLILAATSNDNYSYISYPANSPYVMGIGAASPCDGRKRSSSDSGECNPGVDPDPNGYTCDGERWWGSCYGSNTQDAADAVDVIAPTILPTTDIQGSDGFRSGDYEPFFNGTSCATPYAAGVAALIKSANPTWTNVQIRDQLCTTATDIVNVESGTGWDRYSGYGMVDAEAAVGGGGETPPTADFAGDPTNGVEPLTVNFTDMSSGAPTSWSWTFGDGGLSTDQNPTYVYNTAGTYTVTLEATNAYGTDTETKTDYITVDPCVAPVAAFAGSPTSGTVPLTVNFTDQSSSSPTSWLWDFGDGGTSTEQNPSYTYDAVGTYTVTLTAANGCGSDDEIKIDYIDVQEPGPAEKAYALSDIPVAGSLSGDYTNTAASDNSYETITEVAYGGHPVKTYSYLEHKWDFNVPSGTSVTFYLEAYRPASSDGDDFVFAYSTDGTNYTNMVTVASSTERVYSVAMPSSLSGTVYVRVLDTARSWGGTTNDDIVIDEMYFLVETGPAPPVAAFVGSPTTGAVPLTVSFTDQSTGSPNSWSWTFGDGGTSTAQNPAHEYADAGTYTVELTVTNEYGSDTETKTGYITVTDGSATYTHISDIVVGRKTAGPNNNGTAYVTVVDQAGAPVANATVYGFFNEPSTSELSGITGSDGVAFIQGSKTKTAVPDFCFEVTNVVLAGTTYDSGSNAVTRSCETGDVFSAMTVAERKEDIPEDFEVFQNYPNPFNPVTQIRFNLPYETRVKLDVYDVQGRMIETIVNRTLGAGQHNYEWKADNISSGIYFYRLQTPEFTRTMKMILLR